ncbi:hypothetical protein E2C01_089233 [Portunus trituberculatus]|uniref:Uncharacterized protein n=1 Tax=Portunus trituberculatus TaxID=210409 RepID=A0A5B7J889_PORTR|nr:hypothetical protein [Portunus trituberculatus]
MTDIGDKKSKRRFFSRLRKRREPSVAKPVAAGVLVREKEHEELSSVKEQNFIATSPRCPGFTGPVIVGVVWKEKFLCSGDKNEKNAVECKEKNVNCNFIATTPRCPGFTGPVIVGVVWKKEFLCCGDKNEEEMECKGNNVAYVGEVEQAKNSRQNDEVHGKKKKVKVWKRIWQWLMKRGK